MMAERTPSFQSPEPRSNSPYSSPRFSAFGFSAYSYRGETHGAGVFGDCVWSTAGGLHLGVASMGVVDKLGLIHCSLDQREKIPTYRCMHVPYCHSENYLKSYQ